MAAAISRDAQRVWAAIVDSTVGNGAAAVDGERDCGEGTGAGQPGEIEMQMLIVGFAYLILRLEENIVGGAWGDRRRGRQGEEQKAEQ